MMVGFTVSLFFRPSVYWHPDECGFHPVESFWYCSGCGGFPQILKSGDRNQCCAVLHTVWRGEDEDLLPYVYTYERYSWWFWAGHIRLFPPEVVKLFSWKRSCHCVCIDVTLLSSGICILLIMGLPLSHRCTALLTSHMRLIRGLYQETSSIKSGLKLQTFVLDRIQVSVHV